MSGGGPIRLRRARADDRDSTFLWRNDERVRRFALDPRPIDPGDHARWFERTLRSRRRVLLIAEAEDGPVGVLRYDLDGPRATVSIYLVPDRIGRGFGPRILEAGSDWLRRHRPAIRVVRAEIQPGNEASLRAFRRVGYEDRFLTLEQRLDGD